ncbi:MAG: hypothetical protein JXA60_09200 [Candidatus Coatesbacteria bacterium]|nr:hypothetical protein [Candidatus Coatesbacteria bacterium]
MQIQVGPLNIGFVGLKPIWTKHFEIWKSKCNSKSCCYKLDYEDSCFFRSRLMDIIDSECKNHTTICLHSLGVLHDEKVLLFIGKSGSGKSTLANKFREIENCKVFSEEGNLVDYDKVPIIAFDTPIRGKEDKSSGYPQSGEVKSIYFLNQDISNRIEKLDILSIVENIYANHWYNLDQNFFAERVLDFVSVASPSIPFFNLYFNKKLDVRELL